MKNLVIVSFPAKQGMIENLKTTLQSALPETRSFDGCISVDTYIEETANTVHLIEDWESLEHQAKYLDWRIETGLLEVLEPLLEGGAAGLKATLCGPKHADIWEGQFKEFWLNVSKKIGASSVRLVAASDAIENMNTSQTWSNAQILKDIHGKT